MYKNNEGYPDETAGKAIKKTEREEKERDAAVTSVITMLKQIISLTGFELVGRIVLRDRNTGKEYK